MDPNFTNKELEELAEFVCGRVNALQDMLDNGRNYSDSMKSGLRRDIKSLDSLNVKLLPYYKAKT